MAPDHSPEHWQAIERLYHAAREMAPAARAVFLDAECHGDASLRREVESLLQYDTAAGRYLESPALDALSGSADADRWPPGHRVGGYEVVAFLGAGGMGDVYQARDLRLHREVALKVLSSVATDPAWLLSFEEEARAASGLTHPNIVTIYGVGDDAGVAFIAMELVRGRTLRERLASSALAPLDAIDLAAQLADALAAAHAAGIVHRDLKPENLMVTPDGRLKVLDFGIAKRRGGVDHPSTAPGAVVGTVGYMSPEQAEGRAVDHRSDQFAFGAIAYEMLCGRRAFEGTTRADTIEAIRTVAPRLDRLDANTPAGLRAVVARCLSKRPEDRYAETRDLAGALRRLRDEAAREGIGPISRRRALWVGGAALASAAGMAAWQVWPSGPRPRSLVVLPFINASGDPSVDYLCEGMAESLIRRLAFVPDLEVRPLSAGLHFKSVRSAPDEAGRRLGVDVVLSGSVRSDSERLQVSAQLTAVSSGAVLWSETYERPAADLLGLQQELARAMVSGGIRRSLDARAQRRFERDVTSNGQAHDLFLRAAHAHRDGGELNYLRARRWLQQAVDRDPTFVLALVSLASTYSVMAIDGFERPSAAWPESNRIIRRALDIDPDLPEAHAEQAASWFFFDHDWAAAEREWNRSIQGDPSPALPDLLLAAALKLWALGRVEDALALVGEARRLDPLTPRLAAHEGHFLLQAGRLADAIRVYSALIEQAPDEVDAHFGLAEAWRAQGEFEKAIGARRRAHELAAGGGVVPFAAVMANARGAAGYRDIERAAARHEIADLEADRARGAYVSPLDLARAHAQLGDAERAFVNLDAAFEENSPGLVFLKVDRAWTPLRGDERLDAAIQALRLP